MADSKHFLPQEVIRAKREGKSVSAEDIRALVQGITDDSVADAQVAAFAMAVFFQGMDPDEGAALTLAMRDSGRVIDWTANGLEKDAPIVDKHSTGGVGDKVSLMLAPIVAACGAYVPMISGRGLGHTGGTLDKLDAIPGYIARTELDSFTQIVRMVGCSIIGQTQELAPADKRFYAIRDITATVESVPLITASILSKKLAAGLGALVMDVKVGNGAFMNNMDDAIQLAKNIVRVSSAAGVPTSALITDMNSVLGRTAGNAVEVLESIEFLTDPKDADTRLLEATLALAGEMLALSKVVTTPKDGVNEATKALHDGRAADVFARMVRAHGGPVDFVDNPKKHLVLAKQKQPLRAKTSGYISQMDTRGIGMTIVGMGGGRTNPTHDIDHSVGLSQIVQIGDHVEVGDPLLMVETDDDAVMQRALKNLDGMIKVGENPAAVSSIINQRIIG